MTTETRKPLYTGGCQCGAVRYALYGEPHNVHICHCRMCQKAVGGPFTASAPVKRVDFAWTRGTPAEFASSSLALRAYCRDCGTPLGFRYLDTEICSVSLGSLDRPQDLPPEIQYGVESRIGWLDQINALPRKVMESEMPAARKAKRASYQHPDHDTPEDWKPARAK
ncbi:MAG TPA: GFA family protein [Stellaceae bacterium]|nr:GFA family protein [Stellaceae bacterium]